MDQEYAVHHNSVSQADAAGWRSHDVLRAILGMQSATDSY